MRGVVQSGVKLIQFDRFDEQGNGARAGDLFRRTGNENHARVGIFRHDVAASGGAIEFRHLVIHQHGIGLVPAIGVNRFQARAYDLDHFMIRLLR